jgi:hypothetical protein
MMEGTMNHSFGLTIELGDAATYSCPCCMRESETVHGFLYDDAGETAVYFAGYTHGHTVRRANLALSIGGWGEGTTPADRRSVALQVSANAEGLTYIFPPAETSPWSSEELLGTMLNPEQVSEEDRALCRELARTAVEKDPRIAEYLARG